jgi:hypothetical protein
MLGNGFPGSGCGKEHKDSNGSYEQVSGHIGVFLSSWLVGEAAVVKRNKVAKRFYHIEFMNR